MYLKNRRNNLSLVEKSIPR